MLFVENLTKKFKEVTAVDNISFKIEKGKIFGLLGPNGAGKTTTIRTVLNIIKPTSGKITFEEKPITDEFFNEIGYLPEDRGLYKKSKVIDVIVYFAQLKNLTYRQSVSEAENWLKRLEILNLRDKRIEELSKGNQQKIQFIIAVIHNPKLLIMDEPFSGFDPINQQLIKDIILSFVDSGKIIMLCTHQMDTAEKLCSDILLINNGKEISSGKLSELKKRFGKNHVRVDFEEGGHFLNTHPSVIHIENYSNYAEIDLDENISPFEFLRSIIEKVQIRNFNVVEPTLNKIFIDVMKQNPGDE